MSTSAILPPCTYTLLGHGDATYRLDLLPDLRISGMSSYSGWQQNGDTLSIERASGAPCTFVVSPLGNGVWVSSEDAGKRGLCLTPYNETDASLEKAVHRQRRFLVTDAAAQNREIVLLADGAVGPGSHPERRSWAVSGGRLVLFGINGLSARLVPLPEGGFTSDDGTVKWSPDRRKRSYVVHGLQRTCTNLIQYYFDNELQAQRETMFFGVPYWKHSWLPAAANLKNVFVMICVRHPLDWMVACYEYFKEHAGADQTVCANFSPEWTFQDFLFRQHYIWPSPAERWNSLNHHWLSLCQELGPGATIVRAESFQSLALQNQTLQALTSAYDPYLSLPKDPAVVSRRMTNICTVTDEPMNSSKYWEQHYLARYQPKDLNALKGILNAPLMQRLGYSWPG